MASPRKLLLLVVASGVLALSAAGRTGPPPRAARPNAKALLKQAAEVAADIEDLRERAQLLAFIGQAYHKAGDKAGADGALKQSLETAAKIEEDTPLGSALWVITQVEVKRGNAAGALKACELMENKNRRAGLIRTVVDEQIREGDLKGAQKTAEGLKGEAKEDALARLAYSRARALARAGKIAEARQAGAKFDPETMYSLLIEIAFAHARAKQPDKAKAALAEGWAGREKWLREVLSPDSKAHLLVKHAVTRAEAGDVAGALKTFAESKYEDTKDDGSSKAYYYWRLARFCVLAGDAKAAVKFAEGLKDARDRYVTLEQIAKSQAEAKDKAGARATLAKARKLVADLPAGPTKDSAHYGAGEVEMLLGDAKAALTTARTAKKGRERGLALSAVGRVQRTIDRAAAAKVFAEAARELAAEPAARRWLPMTLRHLAEAGEPALALTFLDKEKSPLLKARGLLYIANGMIDAAKREAKKP